MDEQVGEVDGDSLRRDSGGVTIGVAISGGGARAALFAIGSLLYLVHAGLNRDIRLISSVSGGSIVNAAVAASGDLAGADPVDFSRLMSSISHRMSRRGIFFWPGIKTMSVSIASFTLWAPLFFGLMLAVGAMDDWDWGLFWFGELGYTGVMTLYVLCFTVLGRKTIQQTAYEAFINQVVGTKGHPRLSDFPDSAVTHVLSATELTSGQPFYMSGEMLFCPAYGRGLPRLKISEAIYASAAFPIGFPPLRLKTRTLDLTGGWEDEPPKNLFLSDGGVFNNLGTEAFTANDAAEQIYLPDPSLPVIPQVDRHIVVNASSPPQGTVLSNFPGWRTVRTTARIMSVMYENTLRPRVQRLMEEQMVEGGPIVIDISESPIELADRIAAGRGEEDVIRQRAKAMRDLLSIAGEDREWKTYSDRAALTKTVLSAVGQPAAVRLIRLGYLDTAIACHAHLGTPSIESAPDESWFKCLVKEELSEEQARRPAIRA